MTNVPKLYELNKMHVEDLGITQRSINALERNGIYIIRDVLNKTETELLSLRNLGDVCLIDIKEKLTALGLKLREER